ncbi:hypothetical protein JQX13_23070 [Archangium violaceum]|uniref:hypothetical protein n=1 Tax=Archangium violaceum TaxID=83451 RepID=UPI00193C2313|nr:hypothetical protein [Archangium violaceum]QRK12659.1 hypothetical protein JQX13_23070 [Archangium violaceum]
MGSPQVHALSRIARHEGLQEAFHAFLLLPHARSLSDEREDTRALLSVLMRNAARNMRRRHHLAMPHDDVDSAQELSAGRRRCRSRVGVEGVLRHRAP